MAEIKKRMEQLKRKKITLEKVLKSIETLTPEMNLSDNIIERTRIPLENMINMGRGD